MRKSLLLTLALVFVLGIAGTAFAANPFVDVPAKHWAYDAVAKLAQAGIVDGYGDGTFKGDKTMTRYEMAQIVAKAMARSDKANAEQKAMIDKLSVEFSTELNNLGIRVAALEQKAAADRVNFTGMTYIRYQHDATTGVKIKQKMQGLLQINADAKINDDWNAGMQWEAYRDFRNDKGRQGTANTAYGAMGSYGANGQYDITRAFVSGTVAPGVKLTAGKFPDTLGTGIMYDDALTGGKLEFGNALKVKLMMAQGDSWTGANSKDQNGNLNGDSFISQYGKVSMVQFDYDLSKATHVLASFQQWKHTNDNTASGTFRSKDTMNVWDFGISSKLNADWRLFGNYLQTNADMNSSQWNANPASNLVATGNGADNKAWNVGVQYKQSDLNKPGSYDVTLMYENYQLTTTCGENSYWLSPGEKGYSLMINYVLAKNIKWRGVYYDAKAAGRTDSNTNLPNGGHDKFFRTQVAFYF
ncbi:S-layer homology domain-containing protein [Azotosporobacter soli]|uniref:S-layer homology domain-containing protein n=1 Tax=Azotosporobacter soli TaxID=3055040 RepID=UPI0031FE8C7B